jgi:large subunit ribosomal protein L5
VDRADDLGIPIAAKVKLQGPEMYDFLSMLAEVVLPRVKEFRGVHFVQSEQSGSIAFGFQGSSMALFPQIEGFHPPAGFLNETD